MRILVAEDDASLAEFLNQQLQQEHFDVQLVADGRDARRHALDEDVDLVILDLNLPGASGFDVLQEIRQKRPDLPVLIVTGRGQVEERVRGLDAGADDYLPKPFSFAELAARIRALLRRGSRTTRVQLCVDDLLVDCIARTVHRAGRAIDLSPKELALLEYLMRHAGTAVTRATLMENVWNLRAGTMTNVVDVYINYLRRKVDTGYDRRLIRTVRGIGYQIGGAP